MLNVLKPNVCGGDNGCGGRALTVAISDRPVDGRALDCGEQVVVLSRCPSCKATAVWVCNDDDPALSTEFELVSDEELLSGLGIASGLEATALERARCSSVNRRAWSRRMTALRKRLRKIDVVVPA